MGFLTVITVTTQLLNAAVSCEYYDANTNAFSAKKRDFAIVDTIIHPLDNAALTARVNDRPGNDGFIRWEFFQDFGVRSVYVVDKTTGIGTVSVDTGGRYETPVLIYRLDCDIQPK